MACMYSCVASITKQSSVPYAVLQMVGEDEGRYEDADEEEGDDLEGVHGEEEDPRR